MIAHEGSNITVHVRFSEVAAFAYCAHHEKNSICIDTGRVVFGDVTIWLKGGGKVEIPFFDEGRYLDFIDRLRSHVEARGAK